jgi:hypothetical protein
VDHGGEGLHGDGGEGGDEGRAVLRSPGAFVMVAPGEVEVFANRVLTRAREVAKTLAAMIKFN